ncbi:GNAT family N-acetyltransferase [Erythrobacter dokdonensis]|jgi:RimJ/RimL family protein N-acetyltransferase|uniref:GCN5-related N-acetyltransferase n=1 Tax=Erythrobacter dokdonensis DSW-74 TaxID=1300349 RepID=A0A1A7BD01_9SPHN|nr:GNAT family protein [Erythrobacter dokdonensis]MEE4315500.1 GNAT family protein [Erythrobacter sp.]OBV10369.1 GCN5-related N-acetyltransferase [Erythrobacter dokdonensis DSW-74]
MSSPATDSPIIRTGRLVLRRVRPEADFAAMHRLLCDPQAMAYWATPPHETEAETRDWLAAMAATAPEEGDDFIIEYQGRAVGKVGFFRFPDIGYIIDPALWGQGLVAEALVPVIARAFTLHGQERIIADVDPRNTASIRLLGKLGFAETHRAERTMLIGGEWCDSVYFALSQEDWLARA